MSCFSVTLIEVLLNNMPAMFVSINSLAPKTNCWQTIKVCNFWEKQNNASLPNLLLQSILMAFVKLKPLLKIAKCTGKLKTRSIRDKNSVI